MYMYIKIRTKTVNKKKLDAHMYFITVLTVHVGNKIKTAASCN